MNSIHIQYYSSPRSCSKNSKRRPKKKAFLTRILLMKKEKEILDKARTYMSIKKYVTEHIGPWKYDIYF